MNLFRRRAASRHLASPPGSPSEADGTQAIERQTQWLFWAWAAQMGLALFGAWWMQERALWRALIDGDPSGISLGIVLLAGVTSLWCGVRAWRFQQQALPGSGWRQEHAHHLQHQPELAAQLLSDRCHGPQETAWWFTAAAIKLGLLGTVAGFIIMSLQIGRMPSFDLDQVQNLLKQMTQGMAIALYTTLAGLVANLWMGLQLMLLDRTADRLVADILRSTTPNRHEPVSAAPLPVGPHA